MNSVSVLKYLLFLTVDGNQKFGFTFGTFSIQKQEFLLAIEEQP